MAQFLIHLKHNLKVALFVPPIGGDAKTIMVPQLKVQSLMVQKSEYDNLFFSLHDYYK